MTMVGVAKVTELSSGKLTKLEEIRLATRQQWDCPEDMSTVAWRKRLRREFQMPKSNKRAKVRNSALYKKVQARFPSFSWEAVPRKDRPDSTEYQVIFHGYPTIQGETPLIEELLVIALEFFDAPGSKVRARQRRSRKELRCPAAANSGPRGRRIPGYRMCGGGIGDGAWWQHACDELKTED